MGEKQSEGIFRCRPCRRLTVEFLKRRGGSYEEDCGQTLFAECKGPKRTGGREAEGLGGEDGCKIQWSARRAGIKWREVAVVEVARGGQKYGRKRSDTQAREGSVWAHMHGEARHGWRMADDVSVSVSVVDVSWERFPQKNNVDRQSSSNG